MLFSFFYSKKEVIKPVVVNNKDYNFKVYEIKLNNFDINNYKFIFNNIAEENYKILDFRFDNNYYKNINKKINKIKITEGNYIDTITEYINKYVEILYYYDMESEVSKIKTGNMLIYYIKIYTTDKTYNKIKKMQQHP